MSIDLEIVRKHTPLEIDFVAEKLGINPKDLYKYGNHIAKVQPIYNPNLKEKKLILVSAISPTPAGEGKTTTSIGLVDALAKIGKKVAGALREPSLGPIFGMKGGATGGGYAQLLPMEDINLHFTGDFSAIEKTHNLLSSIIDNHTYFNKSESLVAQNKVTWKRVFDINDRALRNIITGLNGNGFMRETGFDITAASEIMAIFCMSKSFEDLEERLNNIIIGFSNDSKPVYAKEMKVTGALMTLLLKAMSPNLVQTLEHNPILVHGGPFANIAQGTNSISATYTAMHYADYVVTEAGFGFDLGGEKFLDIKCQETNISPSCIVLVATIRALKYHGGVSLNQLTIEDLEKLKIGFSNLRQHIENALKFGIKPIVALNKFTTDTKDEIDTLVNLCNDLGVEISICNHWSEGGMGALDLAEKVVKLCYEPSNFTPLYNKKTMKVVDKIGIIAREIYRAEKVEFGKNAEKVLNQIEEFDLNSLYVCMAKTQYSFSDNPKNLGAPINQTLHINNIEIANGAGFVVPIAGEIIRMPGLPKRPSAENFYVSKEGLIEGLS